MNSKLMQNLKIYIITIIDSVSSSRSVGLSVVAGYLNHTCLNYNAQSLIYISAITGCASISFFALLVGIPIDIPSSAVGLQTCAITVGIKSINQ